MYATENGTGRGESVTLYVRDPARSQEFYQDLFGLILSEDPATQSRRLLLSPGDQEGVAIVLRNRTGLSDGPLWLSVEVGSVSEVLDMYLLAIMMGARAMLPRKRGRRWSTEVTDPDGNRIAIWTRTDEEDDDDDYAAVNFRPHRWEWSLTGSADLEDHDVEATVRPSRNRRITSADEEDKLTRPGRTAGAECIDEYESDRSALNRARTAPSVPDDRKSMEGKE